MSIKDVVRRGKFKLKHSFLVSRNAGLILALVIFVICTYLSVMAMSRNWELTETLARERGQLELLKTNVEMMEMENAYYQSAEYQELMARKLLDKKLPGENMVVMPENSEKAKTKHQKEAAPVEEREMTNLEKWKMFLFPEG